MKIINDKHEIMDHVKLIEKAQVCVDGHQEKYDMAKGAFDTMLRGQRRRESTAEEDAEDEAEEEE